MCSTSYSFAFRLTTFETVCGEITGDELEAILAPA